MKKLLLLSTSLVILLVSLISNIFSGQEPKKLASPIVVGDKVLGINQWLPQLSEDSQLDAPKISAEAGLFIDTKTSQVLYAKNQNKKLPIASLVKVMTALIVLERKGIDDQFVVSSRASEMEPDKMLLIPGEKLNLKELLYGIFLISANDVAEVIAEGTTNSREEFIKLMNAKARQLGMKDSFFVNPTGLDEDSNNSYSTTYDLAILTRYLIRRFPDVVNISKTGHIILPKTDTHQDYDMYSGINLLTSYPGVVGFKTGYTPEAGLTLITLAQRGEHEVIGVLLGSQDRRDEAKELLEYSFKKLDPYKDPQLLNI